MHTLKNIQWSWYTEVKHFRLNTPNIRSKHLSNKQHKEKSINREHPRNSLIVLNQGNNEQNSENLVKKTSEQSSSHLKPFSHSLEIQNPLYHYEGQGDDSIICKTM